MSTQRRNPNPTTGEYRALVDQRRAPEEGEAVAQLPDALLRLRDRILGAHAPEGQARPEAEAGARPQGRGAPWTASGFRGELTIVVPADRIIDVLRFCRDDADVRCELLADLSGVHWPGGTVVDRPAETTGWPATERKGDGSIEIDYVLYSVTHNHRLRLRVFVDDEDPRVATSTGLYGSANFMEREVYDFFGVVFEGHPDLRRILMPDEWEGHPHRKDYPLGGVEVQYKGATIPPPDQRTY